MFIPRQVVIVSLVVIILTGCSGQHSSHPPTYRIRSGSDLTLFTTTDLHYLSTKLTDHGPAFKRYLANGDGKQLQYSDEMMNAFAYDIENQQPDIVLISGDLTNNGEEQSHRDMAEHLKAIEHNSGTQVYVIPGNHDLLNPWARQFRDQHQYYTETISAKEFRKIYKSFGYMDALLQDENTLSYLATPSDDLWLLMLDTSQHLNNNKLGYPQLEGKLRPSTLEWIDKCGKLASQNGAQIVAVMHHNLLDHNEIIKKGYTVNNNQDVISALLRNDITTVLSGHIHIQDISHYQQDSKQIHDITRSALSVYPHQFGILKYSSMSHTLDYSTSKLNMELWAKESGNSDPNLLDYSTYSKTFLRHQSTKRTLARLSVDSRYDSYPLSQQEAMAEVVGHLYELYCSGSAHTQKASIIASPGYRLWMNAPTSEIKSQVLWLSGQDEKDNNHLHVELSGR